MKKLLSLIALIAIPTSAQNSHDTYYCGNPNTPCIVIGAYGANMGQIGRISEGTFGLSYGPSLTTMGTADITFSTTGAVNVPGAFTAGSIACTTATYPGLSLTYGVHAATGVFTGAVSVGSLASAGAISGTSAAITGTGGAVLVSTSATSGYSLCLAGAFSTLPTTGYPQGCIAYLTSDPTHIYLSTQAVVGVQSWLAK